jgi:sugar phosphate permease
MDHSPSASVGRPEIVQKVTRRLILFVGICYLIAYIDRQNVSFAKLQMAGDLGLSEYAYGLGASLFFIGYFCLRCRATSSWKKSGRGGGSRGS